MNFNISLMLIGMFLRNSTAKYSSASEVHGVISLTPSNYEEIIKNNEQVLVNFITPFCVRCKIMVSHYLKLAPRLKKENSPTIMAQIDGAAHAELASKFEVKHYPAIKLFWKQEIIEYHGEYKEQKLYEFVQTFKHHMKARKIEDINHLNVIEHEKLAIVYVFPEQDETSLRRINALSVGYPRIHFFYSHLNEIREKYNAKDDYLLIVFRNFDDGTKFLMNKSPLTYFEIKHFIDAHRHPYVMEYDREAVDKIFKNQLNSIILFTKEHNNPVFKEFQEVAQKMQHEIVFAHALFSSPEGTIISRHLGVKTEDDGTMRIIEFTGRDFKKFECLGKKSVEIENCIKNFKAKKLLPVYKSEDHVPLTKDAVKTVIGKTFKHTVLDNDKHVLLNIYSHAYPDSKLFEPIYEEFAKKLQEKTNEVLVTKFDSTLNEYPDLIIKGYPTLLFYKKGDKANPIIYKGTREIGNLMKFIDENIRPTKNSNTIDNEEL